MEQQPTYTLRIFCIHQFCHWFSLGLIIPILTLFMMDRGLDLFDVGICIALYSAMTFLFELPTGGLADQLGRKKVFLLSTLVSSIGILLLLLLHFKSVIYIGFCLMGISRSLSSGTIDAWFINRYKKEAPDKNLQTALAKAYFWMPTGIGIGTLIGGVLPLFTSYLKWERYLLNFMFMLVGVIWTGIFTAIWIKEKHDKTSNNLLTAFHSSPTILKEAYQFSKKTPVVYLLLSSMAIWGIAVISVENLWQPKVKMILGSEQQSWIFGLLSAGYFFSSAIGKLLAIPVCRLFKNRYEIVLTLFRTTMGLSIILLSYQTNIILFGFIYFLMFLQNGVLHSPHDSLFHSIIPDNKRSIFISLHSSFIYLGGMIGSFNLGWVAKVYSISHAWKIGGTILICSSVLYLLFSKSAKEKIN